MATIHEFIRANNITYTSEPVPSNPNITDTAWAATAKHYRVTLRRPGHRMTTYFSMGSAHTGKPRTADVLGCLVSDANGVEKTPNFEEWARDYGYDTDSIKAQRIFQNCVREARRLNKFLGDSLYRTLLWDTDSL